MYPASKEFVEMITEMSNATKETRIAIGESLKKLHDDYIYGVDLAIDENE